MKKLSHDEAAAKIAKLLAREVKEKLKAKKPSFSIALMNDIEERSLHRVDKDVERYCRWGGEKDGVTFAPFDGAYERSRFSGALHAAVMERVKLPKGVVAMRHSHTECSSGAWWSTTQYDVVDSVTFVRVCPDFGRLNAKLEKMGCKRIDLCNWRWENVSGKRGTIFDSESNYFAAHSEYCKKALDALKGRRKASWEYRRIDHCEDREYGELYETEWSGAIHHAVQFKDADGKVIATV